MDTRFSDYRDAFNILLVDAKVGATNGDGDASPPGSKTRDNLKGKTECVGVGWVL